MRPRAIQTTMIAWGTLDTDSDTDPDPDPEGIGLRMHHPPLGSLSGGHFIRLP